MLITWTVPVHLVKACLGNLEPSWLRDLLGMHIACFYLPDRLTIVLTSRYDAWFVAHVPISRKDTVQAGASDAFNAAAHHASGQRADADPVQMPPAKAQHGHMLPAGWTNLQSVLLVPAATSTTSASRTSSLPPLAGSTHSLTPLPVFSALFTLVPSFIFRPCFCSVRLKAFLMSASCKPRTQAGAVPLDMMLVLTAARDRHRRQGSTSSMTYRTLSKHNERLLPLSHTCDSASPAIEKCIC